MGIWTLKSYMDKVADIYKAAAGEVAKDAAKLDELKAKRDGVWSDAMLNISGKHEMAAKYANEMHAVNRHIAEVQANAKKAALAVRADVERDFYDYYNATVGDFDEKTAAAVNSGLYTDKELLHMAETANRTMKRVIGAKLAESKDEMIAFRGRVLQQTSLNPHLEAIDGMMGVGKYATGGGPHSGVAGAAGFLERWDEVTKPVYDAAPKVGYYRSALRPGMATQYFEGECPYSDDD